MSLELFSCKDATVRYAGSADDSWRLRVPDFTISEGELCLLSGDNMSGKSTFLRMVASMGDDLVVSGTFGGRGSLIDACYRDVELALLLSSDDEMFPELSILENIEVAVPHGDMIASAPKVIERLLSDAGVFAGRSMRSPLGNLSSGGRALVKFCRALVSKRRLVLLDEISSFLDRARSRVVLDAAIDITRNGRAVVLVSHSDRDRAYLAASFPVRRFHLKREVEESVLRQTKSSGD